MSTRPRLEVQQSFLQCSARLREPSLRLAPTDTRLADELLGRLARFGAQLDTLSMAFSPQNLAESRVTVAILGGYASVQLSPAGAEVSFQGPGEPYPNVPLILPRAELSQILAEIETIVTTATEQPRFAAHTFTLNVHARLHGQGPDELLRAFVRDPPAAFGELHEVGVRYVFKPGGTRVSSWLVAEPSAVIQPGLFVNCAVTLDGDQVGLAQAAEEARDHLKSILESADCPVEVGHE